MFVFPQQNYTCAMLTQTLGLQRQDFGISDISSVFEIVERHQLFNVNVAEIAHFEQQATPRASLHRAACSRKIIKYANLAESTLSTFLASFTPWLLLLTPDLNSATHFL